MMKRKVLKTFALALMVAGGWSQVWADGVNLLSQSGISATGTTNCSTSISDSKLTVTPSSTGEFRVTLSHSTGISIATDKVFFVVEMDNTDFQTSNQNIRNIVFGGTTYDSGSGNVLNFDVDGKKVCIYSSLMIYKSNSLLTAYQGNESLTLTSIAMNFRANATTSRVIYTAGFYNLSDILTKYSSLASNNYQISNYMRLLNDNSVTTSSKTNTGSRTGEIALKNSTSDAVTSVANAKLWCKAVDFAHLPNNYGVIYLRYWKPTDATTEDLFKGLDENVLLRIPFSSSPEGSSGTISNYLSNTPTMHKRITDFDNKIAHTAFVDGVAPSSAITTTGTATTNWASYSRSLKAGYNSCVMPFKKLAYAAPTGITFYKVGNYADGTVSFTKIEDPKASNSFTDGSDWTPVIIKAEAAGIYTFVGRDAITSWDGITYKSKKVGNSGTDPNGIYWVGSFVNEVPTGDYASTVNYGITSDGTSFAKMGSGVKTTYYRAFLADNRGNNARALTLSFGDEATGISSIKADKGDNSYYNLSGLRVENPTKGLYIVNGKKVVIK